VCSCRSGKIKTTQAVLHLVQDKKPVLPVTGRCLFFRSPAWRQRYEAVAIRHEITDYASSTFPSGEHPPPRVDGPFHFLNFSMSSSCKVSQYFRILQGAIRIRPPLPGISLIRRTRKFCLNLKIVENLVQLVRSWGWVLVKFVALSTLEGVRRRGLRAFFGTFCRFSCPAGNASRHGHDARSAGT